MLCQVCSVMSIVLAGAMVPLNVFDMQLAAIAVGFVSVCAALVGVITANVFDGCCGWRVGAATRKRSQWGYAFGHVTWCGALGAALVLYFNVWCSEGGSYCFVVPAVIATLGALATTSTILIGRHHAQAAGAARDTAAVELPPLKQQPQQERQERQEPPQPELQVV